MTSEELQAVKEFLASVHSRQRRRVDVDACPQRAYESAVSELLHLVQNLARPSATVGGLGYGDERI